MMETINNHLNGYLSENKEFSGLSQNLQNKLKDWDKSKKPIERLNWNEYFLAMAYLVRLRSPDARTRCGAVIVDQNNHTIVSSGYNGFLSNIDERIIPNYSDEKYPFMIHAELNALLNSAKQGKSTTNCIIYLTGLPCFTCLQSMWQAGISKVFSGKQFIHMIDNTEYQEKLELFKYLTSNQMPVIETDFDESRLAEILK